MAQKIDDLGLTVDEEFCELGRYQNDTDGKLQAARYEDLKDRVIADGKFDTPLKAWAHNGKTILYDGYTRYELWLSGDLPDEVRKPVVNLKKFKNRLECKKEVARIATKNNRNLRREDLEALSRFLLESGESVATVAAMTGVDKSTVRRTNRYQTSLKKLPKALREAVDGKDVSIPKSQLPKMSKKEVAQSVENCLAGRKWNEDAPNEAESGKCLPETAEAAAASVKALVKVVIPQLQEHNVLLSRAIHPKGQPVKGGYQVEKVSKIAAQILGLVEKWNPSGVCEECEGAGCSVCGGRGWSVK